MKNFKQNIRLALQALVVSSVFSVSAQPTVADDPFFRAVANDDASTMSTLFLRGTDPNMRGPKGQLALVLALQANNERALDQLMSHPDIKIDLANDNGETPLMMAALRGQVAWMQKLLARGAQVQRNGWSPLHYAASGPSVAAVQLLLERGAPLNALSPNGSTPLMMAARYGAEDSARLLLKAGADASLRNEQQLQATDFAKATGRDRLAADLAQAAAR